MKRTRPIVIITLVLSVTALFIEQAANVAGSGGSFGSSILESSFFRWIFTGINYAVLLLLILEFVLEYRSAPYKWVYFKRNTFPLIFTGFYIVLFVYNNILTLLVSTEAIDQLPMAIVIIRSIFVLLRVFSRLRRLSAFIEEITTHPAQTIIISFLLAILIGSLLLMMPFTAMENEGLSFVDALFTATSAVCVTGLVVVDTATAFSLYGKLIILVLIQIGGLGIMILSYFTIYILRRSVSIEDKMLISYILSERDMTKLSRSLKNIIYTTLVIEAVGSILLSFGMRIQAGGSISKAILLGIFHSVSAFCNAGFSLFSDSLQGFSSNRFVVFVIAGLIISGGLSFAVLTNLRVRFFTRVKNFLYRRKEQIPKLSFNSRIVLILSVFLLISGTLIIYGVEHKNTITNLPLGEQYLAAFFQSVTLRTAGFNTMAIHDLRPAMYFAMALFMFVGGASGSTAGGIKVNTLAVLFAFLPASVRYRQSVSIGRTSVPTTLVLRAFQILLFGVIVVAFGTVLLSLFEDIATEKIMFEVISAFGTVGLSAGITGDFSIGGKLVIIPLMFMGRLGPLTILAAASLSVRKPRVEYPRGEIAIG